jgi:hypothetical protein
MRILITLSILFYFSIHLFAQREIVSNSNFNKEVYFSWGYNKEWYAKSDIHVKQAELGNDYYFINTIAHDKPGWTSGILNKALTIPQYNYRLGWRYNNSSAIELNFDHTKYQVSEFQKLHVKGIINNKEIDTLMDNAGKKVLDYQLNNGANFFLFNWVKFFPLKTFGKYLDIIFVSKQGLGFVYPHVENTIFGVSNIPRFQFGGFDIGYEAGVNIRIFKYFFIEYTNKVDYAWYRKLKVSKGFIDQKLATFEVILLGGFNIPLVKK